jgi:hypothetical protein
LLHCRMGARVEVVTNHTVHRCDGEPSD